MQRATNDNPNPETEVLISKNPQVKYGVNFLSIYFFVFCSGFRTENKQEAGHEL